MQFQRAQCAIRIEAPQAKLAELFKRLSDELLVVRDKGISQSELDALIAQKKDQLSKLFATYARTDTDVAPAFTAKRCCRHRAGAISAIASGIPLNADLTGNESGA